MSTTGSGRRKNLGASALKRRDVLVAVFRCFDAGDWIDRDRLAVLTPIWRPDKTVKILSKLRGRGRDGKVSADDFVNHFDEKLPYDYASFEAITTSFMEAAAGRGPVPLKAAMRKPHVSISAAGSPAVLSDLDRKLNAMASPCTAKLSKNSRNNMLWQVFRGFEPDPEGSVPRILLKELGTRTGWPRERNERLLDKLESKATPGRPAVIMGEDFVKAFDEKLPHDTDAFGAVIEAFLEVCKRSCKRRGLTPAEGSLDVDLHSQPSTPVSTPVRCKVRPGVLQCHSGMNSPIGTPVKSGCGSPFSLGGQLVRSQSVGMMSPLVLGSPKVRSKRAAEPNHKLDSGFSLGDKIEAEHGTRVIVKRSRGGSGVGNGRKEMLMHVFDCFATAATHGAVHCNDLLMLGKPLEVVGQQGGCWPEDRNQRLVGKLCDSEGWCKRDDFVAGYEGKLPHCHEAFDLVVTDFIEVAMSTQLIDPAAASEHMMMIQIQMQEMQQQLHHADACCTKIQTVGARVLSRWIIVFQSEWLRELVDVWRCCTRNFETVANAQNQHEKRQRWMIQVDAWQRKWGSIQPSTMTPTAVAQAQAEKEGKQIRKWVQGTGVWSEGLDSDGDEEPAQSRMVNASQTLLSATDEDSAPGSSVNGLSATVTDDDTATAVSSCTNGLSAIVTDDDISVDGSVLLGDDEPVWPEDKCRRNKDQNEPRNPPAASVGVPASSNRYEGVDNSDESSQQMAGVGIAPTKMSADEDEDSDEQVSSTVGSCRPVRDSIYQESLSGVEAQLASANDDEHSPCAVRDVILDELEGLERQLCKLATFNQRQESAVDLQIKEYEDQADDDLDLDDMDSFSWAFDDDLVGDDL